MGTSFFNVFAKGDLGGLVKVENDREAEKTKAAKERNITLASIAAKEQRIADIARLSLNIGEHAADLAKIETDFAEKRGALYAEQAEHPEEDHTGQIRALQDEEATARKAAERKFQDKQREVALARELTSIKARGEDVATGTTAADMRDAQKAFDIAPEEEKAAALAKLDAAKLAHFEAVKATKEHREQLRIATDIADMQASADIKHFAELEQQRVELQRQLSTAKPDEKLELAGKISANAAEYRAALAAYSDKTFDLASTMVDATTGRGQAEQLRNMEAKIGLAQAHRAALDYNPAADPKEKADAEAKINELVKARFEFVAGFERQMRDINDQRELAEITIGEAVNKTLTVKRQIELMERQIIANTREAQTADELRTAELKKQNTELANQITQLKTARALETPAERQDRRAHERLVRRKTSAATARARPCRHRAAQGRWHRLQA